MDDTYRTNYEKNAPNHPTEEEVIDRANQRLKEALGNVDKAEERMARNTGQAPESGS